jgi:hypothetical protein
VPSKTIIDHQAQVDLLLQVAAEWKRPVEYVAEYNIFYSLCKRLRPVLCGEAKGLENAEKIAKDLQKAGAEVSLFTPNQLLGAASVSVASYLVECIPLLSGNTPIVTGATLLTICFGQRKLCALLTEFEKSNDKSKDRFARRDFPACGSVATRDKQPCANRVRNRGEQCWIHA